MNLFGLLCLLVSTVLVNGSSQPNNNQFIETEKYLLTFPQILSSTGNQICLALLNGYVPEEKDLYVTVSDAQKREIFARTFRVEKEAECFDLETKNFKPPHVTLNVQLKPDIDVSQIVPFEPSYGMTMIETSKPVYQPGENLRFRVIGFDGSMKPLNDDFVSIALYNPENVKVMEWPGKSLEKGMKHYETELASNNREGIWKIVGVTKSGETVEKLFQVAKKIQPEVNLKITQGNKFILANEEKHRMVVCAEDRQGIRLNEGLVNVKVGNRLVIRETALEENGCVHFHLKNETFRWPTLVGRAIEGSIEYINRETGDHEYTTFYLPVVRAQVHLRVPSSALVKNYFKPGLPYIGYLIVETPNYTPLANAEVEICYRTTSKPWQFEDSQEKDCKTFVSSAQGVIKYIIPPVKFDVNHIIIEATIPGVEDHQQIFALNRWVAGANIHFIIEPVLRVDSCKRMPEATQFTVLMTRNGSALFDKLYLQSAGRVSSAQVKSVKLTPSPYVPDSRLVIGQWPESAAVYSANVWQEVDTESDKHSVMNRVVMYGLDQVGNLMSDSIAYLKDCLRDESLMSVDVDKNNRISVDLKVQKDIPCSVAIGTSAERGRLTEQKINKLAEKYDDIFAKSFEWDKCSLAQLERNSKKPLTVDFKTNWDTFKEMGLRAVFSQYDIFRKPCEWEVFDEKSLNKSLEGLRAVQHNLPYPEHIMTSLADSANMAQLNQLENSLINDILFWGPKANLPKFLNSLKSSDLASKSEIAVHAICMDPIQGVRSYSVVKALNTPIFYFDYELPRTVYQETVQNVSLYIKRTISSYKQTECIPVEFDIETSDSYEILSEVQPVCACSLDTKVPLRIKPLKTGPLNLRIIARFSSSLNNECSSEIEGFETQQVVIRTNVEVYEPKITLRKYELACKNSPKTLLGFKDYENIHVAQDLINIFMKQIRDDKLSRTNILEVLARFNGLANLYVQNEKKLPTALSRRIQKDILNLFQELSLYKLPRGPFSFYPGNQRVPSLVATSLAYKAIAQIQDKLPQLSSTDVLTELFEYITSRMMKDGCFRPKSYGNMLNNLWPFDHQVSSKELTAFVASTLAEVKQTPKIVLKRALKCLETLESEESDYLTRAMTAYLYAKMNKIDSARKIIQDLESELTNIQNLGERRIPDRFMSEETENLKSNDENLRSLAYLVKAKLALNQTDSIQQYIQKLVGSNLSLNDPAIADSSALAWRILSNEDKSVIAEIGSKKIPLEKFEMKSIESPEENRSLNFAPSEGCVVLERIQEIPVHKYERNFPVETEEKKQDSWESRKGETPAPYIRRGFKILKNQREADESCATRKITICGDKNSKEFLTRQRFVVLLPPNYSLDIIRLHQMIVSRQTPIEAYEIDDVAVYRSSIVVAPMKDACFVVPIVQTGEFLGGVARAEIIKYFSFGMPTVGSIEIQKECSVRARRSAADQSNSSASSAKPNRSTNSQQPNNNQGRGYDTQVETVEQQSYEAPAYPAPAPAYEAPVKGYAAPPAQAYEPSYPAPAYEAPVKGYAPPPTYQAPAYEPQTYQAPAYEPSYPAPAYEAPVKGYAPPPTYQAPAYEPAYPAPAYPAPAYPAPAYPAPAYEAPVKGYPAPTYQAPAYEPQTYQAPAYEAPVKGYAPPAYAPPAYEPPTYQAPAYEAPAYEAPVKGYPAPTYQAPAYEPAYPAPAYPAPAYEAPVKGYPAPTYQAPAYEPAYPAPAYPAPAYPAPAYEAPVKGYPAPAYQAPAYETQTYQAPAYEAPVKGYPAPAYAPPAYQAPAYEPPAYQAPAYEAPVKGYAPPAYAPPAYEPPVKGYAPPAYAPPAYSPPAYAPPAYAPPAYAPPAYEAPAYQAPAYEAPAKGYSPPAYAPPAYAPPAYAPPAYAPPAYAPPAYAPPAYAPPAYEAPAYQAPAYETPAKGYPALPPPPAYAPPAYEAPAYRETQGRSTNLRYGNSFASNNGQQARNPQRGNSQNQQRGNNMKQAFPVSRAALPANWQKQQSRMNSRQAFSGSKLIQYSGSASEIQPVVATKECLVPEVSSTCPVCQPRFEIGLIDNLCNSSTVLSVIKPTQITKEMITCGSFDVVHSYGTNKTQEIQEHQFSVNPECECEELSTRYVIMVSDLFKSDELEGTRTPKQLGAETVIVPATPANVQTLATFFTTVCS